MDIYSSFDYLCNEPFYFEGIGTLKSPTLRDIRNLTYKLFCVYINIVNMTLEDYLKMYSLEEQYNSLTETEKSKNTLYHLLLSENPDILVGLLNFFILEEMRFDTTTNSFFLYGLDNNGNKKFIGVINNENFESLRIVIQKILGVKKAIEEEQKFKNAYAKKMYEMLNKNNKSKRNDYNEDFDLDNMIKKYCTHNKVGINILNVWDMTYYQFLSMFNEYCNGRQFDFNDLMAANTFSYKKSSDYKPDGYMKKIK